MYFYVHKIVYICHYTMKSVYLVAIFLYEEMYAEGLYLCVHENFMATKYTNMSWYHDICIFSGYVCVRGNVCAVTIFMYT